MADLPTYTDQDLVKQIGVVSTQSTGQGFDRLAAGFRSVASDLGDMAEKQGAADATEAGQQTAASLQRDSQGNLQPLPWRDNSSPENRAYNEALKAGAVAGFENDQKSAAVKYRAQFPFDAEGFGQVWAGHTEGTLSTMDPRFAPLAKQKLAQLGAETQNGIINVTRERDFTTAEQGWHQSLLAKENDLASMAAAGQTDHPAYQQGMNDFLATLNQGVDAKFIDQTGADVRRVQIADQGEALALSKHAVDAYQSAGRGANGMMAADKMLEQLQDPKYGLSPERQFQVENVARRRIDEQEAIRRTQVDQLWQQAEPTIAKLNLGVNIPPGEVDTLRRGLIAAGAPERAAHLETAALYQQQIGAVGKLPVDQQLAKLDDLNKRVEDGTATLPEAQLAAHLPSVINANVKAMQADPFAVASAAHPEMTGPVPPVDWNAPTPQLSTTLMARGMQAEKLSQYEGQFVPPLTAGELQSLGATIQADPANAAARINAIQQASGAAWPSIWRGLTTMGTSKGNPYLPLQYQAVAAVDNPAQAGLLARALGEEGKSGKSLTDLLPPKSKTQIDESVENDPQITALLTSLSRSGASAGQQDAILQSVKTLAYANLHYNGTDRSTAIANAVSAFTGKYEFLPNGGARVPAGIADNVTAAAAQTLSGLKSENLSVPELYGKPGQAKPEEYAGLVKASPTWITSPQADALWLMDPGGRLVRDKGGKPISVPFTAMPSAGLPPNQAPYLRSLAPARGGAPGLLNMPQ